MAKITADLTLCQGYANCVVGAGDFFDIDDDGLVIILQDDVDDAHRKRVAEAAQSCPVSALLVVDE